MSASVVLPVKDSKIALGVISGVTINMVNISIVPLLYKTFSQSFSADLVSVSTVFLSRGGRLPPTVLFLVVPFMTWASHG